VADPPSIAAVGHGARPIDELIALLRDAGIRLVVDVRTAPGSRRHPQFGQDRLTQSLAETGIGYDWQPDLGGWRKPRGDSPHTALRNPSFRGYADHMDTEAFAKALAWLERRALARPTAFLCAESLWWRCHRRLIADALVVRGWDVRHLIGPGRSDPHRLHPAARVVGTALRYDVTASTQPQLGE
jgi:uncharacterized protein (DUF488 family)